MAATGNAMHFHEGFVALLIPRFRRAFTRFFVVTLVGTVSSVAAAGPSRQYEIEAVMLFNLARFVDWPPECFSSTNSPLVLGIFGPDPFGPALDSVIKGESVNGHKIEVRRFSKIEEASRCQILYISPAEKAKTGRIVAALKGLPVLTVSDEEGFCRRYGGMVGFYVNEQNKIRLRLNLEAAKLCGLHVSAKLIQVAELEKTGLLQRSPKAPGLQFLTSRILTAFIGIPSNPAPGNSVFAADSGSSCTQVSTILRCVQTLIFGG
jgi:hypothetical protein